MDEERIQAEFNAKILDVEAAHIEGLRRLLFRHGATYPIMFKIPRAIFHLDEADRLERERDEKILALELALMAQLQGE